ncbi:hypothetical protein BCR33DRAFT_719483 [Rhizoclosmatium globosum]|uniref:Uncharacterized protein n=1 Tax=Rhizoclosmatium globosum TaxID=329046 RepID=A0A1Y2C0J1_9FUNG|nr:hypothetical protein BCR33DRAFT_719483 [Rhizoclosmatium globosum]|eukprot:ORY40529.1 hypothetical protein BCR33DRAFT_719483 [Rhizoclosmatium globosum]
MSFPGPPAVGNQPPPPPVWACMIEPSAYAKCTWQACDLTPCSDSSATCFLLPPPKPPCANNNFLPPIGSNWNGTPSSWQFLPSVQPGTTVYPKQLQPSPSAPSTLSTTITNVATTTSQVTTPADTNSSMAPGVVFGLGVTGGVVAITIIGLAFYLTKYRKGTLNQVDVSAIGSTEVEADKDAIPKETHAFHHPLPKSGGQRPGFNIDYFFDDDGSSRIGESVLETPNFQTYPVLENFGAPKPRKVATGILELEGALQKLNHGATTVDVGAPMEELKAWEEESVRTKLTVVRDDER